MKNVLACLLLAALVCPASAQPKKTRLAATCFNTGESSSGMTKICYYDCLGSPAAITVSAVSLCPLTINR